MFRGSILSLIATMFIILKLLQNLLSHEQNTELKSWSLTECIGDTTQARCIILFNDLVILLVKYTEIVQKNQQAHNIFTGGTA